jgi:hypothetical protein
MKASRIETKKNEIEIAQLSEERSAFCYDLHSTLESNPIQLHHL